MFIFLDNCVQFNQEIPDIPVLKQCRVYLSWVVVLKYEVQSLWWLNVIVAWISTWNVYLEQWLPGTLRCVKKARNLSLDLVSIAWQWSEDPVLGEFHHEVYCSRGFRRFLKSRRGLLIYNLRCHPSQWLSSETDPAFQAHSTWMLPVEMGAFSLQPKLWVGFSSARAVLPNFPQVKHWTVNVLLKSQQTFDFWQACLAL